MKSLTWKTKNRGNNQVSRRFGKYSFKPSIVSNVLYKKTQLFLRLSWQAVFDFLWCFCFKYEKCHFFSSLKTLLSLKKILPRRLQILMVVQGVPTQTFIFHFALAGRNMQASIGLKVIWEFWIADFLLMTLGFGQK